MELVGTDGHPRSEVGRGITYLMVGAVAFGVDLVLFAVLHGGFDIPSLVANTLSTLTAVGVSFTANAVWTFGVTNRPFQRFVTFLAVAICGYLISSGLLWTLSELAGVSAILVKIVAVPVVVAVQYRLNSRITFASRPAEHSSTHSRPVAGGSTVGIIGAGFTGLAAGYELAKAGHRVDIYEASDCAGGLAAGFALADGTPLERAYHFAYTTDTSLIATAHELGVDDCLRFHPSSIVAFVDGTAYPFTGAIDLLRFAPLPLHDRVRTGLTCLWLTAVRDWRPLARVTAYDWLCRVSGRRATDLVWKPLLVGKFDAAWDRVSMAWLWGRIRVRKASTIAGSRRQHLGYFDGGFAVLVNAWLNALARLGATVRLRAPVSELGHREGRPMITIGSDRISYDAVLVTVPSPVFAKIAMSHPQMSTTYSDQLHSIEYLSALIMIVVTKTPVSTVYWHQVHDPDAPFLVVLSLDALTGQTTATGRHVLYVGDYMARDHPRMRQSDKEVRQAWFQGLSGLFAAFDPADVEECHIFRFRDAQHVVDVNYPSKIPAARTPLDGYFLANFSQIFPDDRGTNFAIRDGLAAAKLISDSLSPHGATTGKRRQ